MTRQRIVERIERTAIVPVIRAPSAEVAVLASRAVYDGGVDIVEITMTVPFALDVIAKLSAELSDQVLIGAGTVLDADTARACIFAGAKFVVSPGLDVDTIRACHALECPCCPGVLTPTEVITAHRAGADICKVFPCSAVGGAEYLKALRAPLPQVKFMPTGGVDLTTAAGFLKAGAVALGLGAALVDTKLLNEQGPRPISERARQLSQIVERTRAEMRKSL
jgi:2-dehydro-3-deoxyphosphogluconate aldolase/(4S)-4-hydroxy-2-oxoglutarate aldolase